MSAAAWALFGGLSLLALIAALWLYRRRETPGRGRLVLALLRWAAVSVVLLLIIDPVVPASGLPAPGRIQVILDGSLSMRAPAAASGTSSWDAAVAEAAGIGAGQPVLVFGATTRAVPAESLSTMTPAAPASRLLPALQAAAEGGVRRVAVVTDARIEDAADVRRWLPGLGLDVDYHVVGDTGSVNRSLVEVHAPHWVQAGEAAEIEFGIAAIGGAGDTVRVVLLRDGEPVGEAAAAWPQPGRVATGVLRFTATAGEEATVRYDVRIEGEDAIAEDDARTVYVRVTERPAGVVAVGLRADWELRFLQPVMLRALGLPVQGFIFTRGVGFVRSGSGLVAGERVAESEVRAAMAGADLLVLQGVDASSPAWVLEAGRRARRLLVLPAGPIEGLGLPVETGRPTPAEWYPSADVPPSPVASSLGGIVAEDAPPLTALTQPDLLGPAWSPLLATRGRRGEPAPILVAGETDGRRWAVAMGSGYWRWAFRAGPSQDLYARLWSAMAGWLVRERAAVAAIAVWPAEPVLPAWRPVHWMAPGLEADSLRIRLAAGEETQLTDTIVAVRRDSAVTAAPAPGHYRYQATAFQGDSVLAEASGPFTAETYSPDFAHARVPLADLQSGDVPLAGTPARAGQPLHALPWPYLVLVVLLAAEWVLRRRWGLR